MNDRTNGAPPPEGAHKGRHKTRAEERIEALGTAPSMADQLAELTARAEKAEAEAEANRQSWQRSAADFANYRRRTEEGAEEALDMARGILLLKVLAVADDFDRAVTHVPPKEKHSPWVEGIAAIDRKLHAVLDSEGITPIDVAGEPFDPRTAEAVSAVDTTEVPDGHVFQELQRGYRIGDRVLRPALVTVASNPHSHTHPTHHAEHAAETPETRE